MKTPGVYESYNARHSTPEQIAETFIATDDFAKLACCRNSLVTGPRGSGKTTMLKMLQDRALDAWTAPEAATIKKNVDYTGIFIPYDRLWESQAISENGTEKQQRLLARAAVVASAMMAFANAIIYKIEGGEKLGKEYRGGSCVMTDAQIRGLIVELANLWKLNPLTASLMSFKAALSERMMRIKNIGNKISDGEGLSEIDNELLQSELYPTLYSGIEVFGYITRVPTGKWAFLFDEMELAPDWLQRDILLSMRSSNQLVTIKMSLCPLDVGSLIHGGPSDPQEYDDYDNIELWYPNKKDGTRFSSSLVHALLKRQSVDKTDIGVFGSGRLSAVEVDGIQSVKDSYASDGFMFEAMKLLLEKDPSFARYCGIKGVTLQNLFKLRKNKRAEFRKNAAHIIIRNYAISDAEGESGRELPYAEQRNIRGIPNIYTGIPTLYWITEGNPRWTIGFFSDLLAARDGNCEVDHSKQVKCTKEFIHKYRMKLKAFPCPKEVNGVPLNRGLLDFMDLLGNFFRNECNGPVFNDNHYTHFQVDQLSYSRELEVIIKSCIRVGALVYLPKDNVPAQSSTDRSIIGAQFRICYLLSPYYRIPIALNRFASIKRIFEFSKMSNKNNFALFRQKDNTVGRAVQQELFDAEDK